MPEFGHSSPSLQFALSISTEIVLRFDKHVQSCNCHQNLEYFVYLPHQKSLMSPSQPHPQPWQPLTCFLPSVCVWVCVCARSVAQSCPALCNPKDCSPPGSSVHGISQPRILEWAAISFSKGSSWSRDWTHTSCIGRWILHLWAASEALSSLSCWLFQNVIRMEAYSLCFRIWLLSFRTVPSYYWVIFRVQMCQWNMGCRSLFIQLPGWRTVKTVFHLGLYYE